jgi:chitosanase
MSKKLQGQTTGLDDWPRDWGTAAADPLFRGCQDGVVDAVYYGVAMQHAAAKGFTTALTKAAFYDAQINMGDDDPGFGMRAMIAMADAKTGPLANPPTRDDESKWLGNFLRIRAQIMFNDAETWRGNMYRVANYEKLRVAGNFDLTGCIQTGASSAATWPGSGFTNDRGPAVRVGTCN